MIAQGDIWFLETPDDKRRPVLVVTRDEAVAVLNNVVVAPVTTSIRRIPTCIPLGREEGIDRESVATFDNLAAVPKSLLTRRLGALGVAGRERICAALRSVADC